MKKAKLLAVLLCAGLALTACGNATSTEKSEAVVTEEQTKAENTESQEEVKEATEEVKEEVNEGADDLAKAEETAGNEGEEGSGDELPEAGEEKEGSDEESASSLADIYTKISENVSLVSPMQPGADFIFNYYGIAVSEVEDYVFSVSNEATSAETIIIMKTNGSDQTDSVKGALDGFVEEKKIELQDYLPEEYDIVNSSSVVVKDDYVYLVISHNADAINEIIDAAL